jgi:hypothetical protein
MGLFPTGLMDLQSLRGINKGAKAKGGGVRKTAATPGKAASGNTAGSNKSPATTPKRKLPVVAVADPTPAKRAIKPFKSRIIDEPPPFTEQDFAEILD